jgi:hypothetical protein
MRMTRKGADWAPAVPSSGLCDLSTGKELDPASLATDEPIEMTDWEVQDLAVQIVRDQLISEGCTILSTNGNPSVDPSLWFVRDAGPEWVVVRARRYPKREAVRPSNWAEIARQSSALSSSGHFASVVVASGEQSFAPGAAVAPLLRGRRLEIRYEGLIR